MQILDQNEAFALLCKLSGKWGLKISFDFDSHDHLHRTIPFIDLTSHAQVLSDGCGFFLFDSCAELTKCFNTLKCVGVPENEAVYAASFYPDGTLFDENIIRRDPLPPWLHMLSPRPQSASVPLAFRRNRH